MSGYGMLVNDGVWLASELPRWKRVRLQRRIKPFPRWVRVLGFGLPVVLMFEASIFLMMVDRTMPPNEELNLMLQMFLGVFIIYMLIVLLIYGPDYRKDMAKKLQKKGDVFLAGSKIYGLLEPLIVRVNGNLEDGAWLSQNMELMRGYEKNLGARWYLGIEGAENASWVLDRAPTSYIYQMAVQYDCVDELYANIDQIIQRDRNDLIEELEKSIAKNERSEKNLEVSLAPIKANLDKDRIELHRQLNMTAAPVQ